MTVTTGTVRSGHPPASAQVPVGRRDFDFSPWTELPSATLPVRGARETPATRPTGVGGFERGLAFLGLIAFSPLILLIAVAIKLDSPGGPVFYRQARVGLNRRSENGQGSSGGNGNGNGGERRCAPGYGRLFMLCKFRTMIPDAEKHSGPVWATKNDPRVTRVGHYLRRLRLDEIPQLFNVLAGDMRLIGPRPERPHFVQKLTTQIPEYPRRLQVPPGITGLAQVERSYDASVDDVRRKVMYDLFYAEHRSMRLDVKILMKTLDVALRGRGAR